MYYSQPASCYAFISSFGFLFFLGQGGGIPRGYQLFQRYIHFLGGKVGKLFQLISLTMRKSHIAVTSSSFWAIQSVIQHRDEGMLLQDSQAESASV